MSLSWLPNAISLLRIGLVPPILWLMLKGRHDIALILFIVAGFSDGVDGYLAKRFNWHTRAGALLDPTADKLLIAGTFVTLGVTGHLPMWLPAIVVLRDVVIFGGAMAYNFLVRPVTGDPTRISKLNTAFELSLVLFVLSRAGFHPEMNGSRFSRRWERAGMASLARSSSLSGQSATSTVGWSPACAMIRPQGEMISERP